MMIRLCLTSAKFMPASDSETRSVGMMRLNVYRP